jgi:hypothetical protein
MKKGFHFGEEAKELIINSSFPTPRRAGPAGAAAAPNQESADCTE